MAASIYLAPVGFAVVTPLHHIVGDVRAAVVLGRLPEQCEALAAELISTEVPGWARPVQNLWVRSVRSGQVRTV